MFKLTFKYIIAEYAQKRSSCDRNIAQKVQKVIGEYLYISIVHTCHSCQSLVSLKNVKKCKKWNQSSTK